MAEGIRNLEQRTNTRKTYLEVLDAAFVPSSMIRILKKGIKEEEPVGSLRKAICYVAATGTEVCRLGLYYLIVRPIYNALFN